MAEQRLTQLVDRLEKVTSRLETVATRGGGGAGGGNENTEIVEAFDKVLGGKLKTYLNLSTEIGGDVAKHATMVKVCFDAQRAVLVLASKHKTPKPAVSQDVLKPLGSKVDTVQAFTDKNRASKKFNHLMTIKEGIGCVGWVTVSPKPGQYVKEMFDQALFYGNRVIKEYKGKDEKQIDWMRAFTGAIKELEEYVRTYHTTGLAWNPDGTELTSVSSAPPPPPSGGPPPPPPPGAPPPPPPSTDIPPPKAPTGGRPDPTALFAEINKGANVTAGLKKVTNEMKTHKNPELRGSSVVKGSDIKPKTTTTKPTGPVTKKPPVCELRGQKWTVENQENNDSVEITITDPKYAVIIYKCTKTTIKVHGKCNTIFIDNCKRVGVVFEDVISACEMINCQSIQIQVIGKCPTVSIDKTDGCQVYLSKDSLNCVIVSAKSSEMNILIPEKNGEYSEHAVPEQFKTTWNGKCLVTECTDING